MRVKQEHEEPESISVPLRFQTPSRTEEYREPTPAVPDSENEQEPAQVQEQDDDDNWSTSSADELVLDYVIWSLPNTSPLLLSLNY